MAPLHLFRFHATEELELGAMSMYGPPNAIQGFVGRGHVKATGDHFASIVFERPTAWQELVRASKEDREQTQVERFLRDYELTTGETLALAYERGGDPPDFVLRRLDGQLLGLECTQLVYGDRIRAWSAVETLKTSLLSVNRSRFRHLRGQTVYLTVDTPTGLPPSGKQGQREVCAALEAFRPIHNDFASLPESLAGTDIVQNFGSYTLTAVPLGEYAITPFVRLTGFDLALSIQSDVRGSEAWKMFADRVREKDRAGSEAVLVSCGAPVVRGLSFPSDDLAAEAVIAAADRNALPVTSHVESVYLHSWGSERVVRLIPGNPGAQSLTGR